MSKIGSLFFLIGNLAMLYLLLYNMQNFIGKKQFYGVSLPSEYSNLPQFKALDKKYKNLLKIGFIVIILFCSIIIYVFNKNDFASSMGIFAAIGYNFYVYLIVHNDCKDLKSEILAKDGISNNKQRAIVDMEFLNKRDNLVQKFKALYLLPVLLTLVSSILYLVNFTSLPELIPVHWGLSGIADRFIEKTYTNIILISIGQLILVSLVSFMAINSLRTRVTIDTEYVERSRNENIIFLKKLGYSFFLLQLSTALLFTNTIISAIYSSNISSYLVMFISAIIIISSIYLIYIFIKNVKSKNITTYAPDDDEAFWIWGCIYNNPNDPSFMVQKRFGIGFTVNIGNPLGKIFAIGTVLILIFALFSVFQTAFI